ncbi:MAG: putative selenate ABC transporter substrate-binding protein [Candidatus Tectomicrobia bacterium]|uniref:Selenate ABC transporter substrate-binding protein n=1 Tax=Tectimicrobiota bacterium TaxID=2528274 RepID=A0A937W7J7_UNCTE|nr:putative selenate ABC transporter substrate-binding protein [Candidatus Tectomicrobia bacterium]
MLIPVRSRKLNLVLVACAILYAALANAQTTLKVSAIPDESPTELQRKFAPLGKYLEAKTGMTMEFIPVTDYAATVEGLTAKKLDMVWYGGFTFVQAKIRTNGTAIPLVQRAEDEQFRSVFITQPNSGITSLADLKGKTFTFGSQSSTSGHLMPRSFLLQQGLDPDKDFRRVAFSGAHDATALQVAGGKVDAGALNISVWNKMLEEKKLDPAQVHVFYTTPPYYDYNWTVRGDLDAALVQKLKDAFLSLDPNNPEHKEILALQRASKFISTQPENYKGIEEAARSAGLLK